MVIRLYVGDLFAVGWDEGSFAFVTPVKAIRIGVVVIIIGRNGISPQIEILIKIVFSVGGRHSSVYPYGPSILRPRV